MRIHHIALNVTNPEKTASFYKKHFGFTEQKRYTKPSKQTETILIELKESVLELVGGAKNKAQQTTNAEIHHIAIEVEDVHATYDKLKREGVQITQPKQGMSCEWYCFLKDPDNIRIELYQSHKNP
ncbi:MAG: VOC family protein [Candidatus Woesearchaeota archaeon]